MKQKIRRMCGWAGELLLTGALVLSLAPAAGAEEVCTYQELEHAAQIGPTVNQDVCAIDSNSGSFAVGQAHTWILRGSIPEGLKNARSYVLADQLDTGLSLEPGSGLVILHTRDGRQRPLQAREHYELEESPHRLRLALTPAGMDYVWASLGEGSCTPELRLSFRVAINQSASMGSALSGRARLSYTGGSGVTITSDADCPEVHTGGLGIALTDGASPLSGGRFRLARLTGAGTETIFVDGEQRQAAFVSFYPSADLNGEMVTEMTTDREGRALACGLPYGTYYLVQTGAPGGHEPLTEPMEVTVSGSSHLTEGDDQTVQVTNPRKSQGDTLFYLLFPKNRL